MRNQSLANSNQIAVAASNASDSVEQLFKKCISKSQSREEFWIEFVNAVEVRCMAEVGVYRGDFAAEILRHCEGLSRYYMVDPWRHLTDWNKPANHDDSVLSEFFNEARAKTDFAAAKRTILRGKTTEVIGQIADGELDLAYIDADHTLKGIAIDLIRMYPKVRTGGFLGGDDFTRSVWEHKTSFEPTLVFPFAVYFAEAVGAIVYALPHAQFCLQKPGLRENEHPQFAFVDLTGQYGDIGLQNQFAPGKIAKLIASERFPRIMRAAREAKKLFSR
ncbi:MAG: class I SAM-dependent methyltransferase [Candidatus Sulfotelmatobacter sp.]